MNGRRWCSQILASEYVSDEYRVAGGLHEANLKVPGGILTKARKQVRVGVGDALWCAEYTLAVRVLADAYEDLADRSLDASPV